MIKLFWWITWFVYPVVKGFLTALLMPVNHFGITGITFTGQGGLTTTMYNGAIRFSGTSDQVRIDHCHFTGGLKHNNFIAVYSTIYGVADHLVLDKLAGGQHRAFNGTGSYGDWNFLNPQVTVAVSSFSWRIVTSTTPGLF